MRRSAALLAAAIAAGVATSAAEAKLTPKEEAYVKPLLVVWNTQNAALRVVIQQAAAKNALIAGEKPQNLTLTITLGKLVSCKVPKDLVAKAGTPPSARLVAFKNALSSACTHDLNGANDFGKAIGAVGKGDEAGTKSYLSQGVAEFKLASMALGQAYNDLATIGGKSLF